MGDHKNLNWPGLTAGEKVVLDHSEKSFILLSDKGTESYPEGPHKRSDHKTSRDTEIYRCGSYTEMETFLAARAPVPAPAPPAPPATT